MFLLILSTFLSFRFANSVQEDVLRDLQDVVSRQRSINNVRRNLPDIHERMSNLSNLYMMEGHVGLEPSYLQALTENINHVEEELAAILEKFWPSYTGTFCSASFSTLQRTFSLLENRIGRLETHPSMAVVELAVRAEPSSLRIAFRGSTGD